MEKYIDQSAQKKDKLSGKDIAHPKRELEILAQWQAEKIFEKSLAQREGKGDYVFFDGPPFATGLPHYGHILGSVAKDVVGRYFTMRGFYVRRRWGWDCHGLPIESLIEKELKVSGKKDIEEKIGEAAFNEACRSKVLLYTQEWKKMVDRIGRWVDIDDAYKTMDPTYMESVWWALKRMWDKDLIYEGRKVLMYCPHCETPVSKAEIAMDNSYKDVTEEAVVVKLRIKNYELRIKRGERHAERVHSVQRKLREASSEVQESKIGDAGRGTWDAASVTWLPVDAPTYILAWTTTPWTLPANVALAVGEDIDYVLVKESGVYYIVAEARLATVFVNRSHEVIQKMRGIDLLGLKYEPLFDVPAIKNSGKEAYYVAPANFVTTEDGTGIVHTAVMYGEDDFNLGAEMNLPMVPLLDAAGRFNANAPEFLQGKYIKKAAHVQEINATKLILDYLTEKDLLFSREQYTHSYPHCWRCDTALIYNAISAWFINIQKVKPRMLEMNEKINWYPDHLKHGRFENILDTAPDWNISRNRYWATPLPFWRCEGRGARDHGTVVCPSPLAPRPCNNVVCIGSVAELKERAINFYDVFKTDVVADMDLHKHIVDGIKLKCDKCGGEMTRIPEVIDCWVESASMPFAELHYPFAKGSTEMFRKRINGEGKYIAEYVNQTRAWFYYMHALSVLLEEDYQSQTAFTNVVTTGVILTEKGEKMSKSKKNYPDPWAIIEKYGVDTLRCYLMGSPVMKADDLNFSEREMDELYKKVILITRNVVAFWEMYARGAGRGTRDGESPTRPSHRVPRTVNVMDKWIVARTDEFVGQMTSYMDVYQITDAARLIAAFVDDLSTWYVRRSRDRFRVGNGHARSEDSENATEVLRWVLHTFAIIVAPITPYLAEHIYKIVGGEKESVHLEEWPSIALSSRATERSEGVEGTLLGESRIMNQEAREMTNDKYQMTKGILEDMKLVRQIVEAVHSIRKEKGIRLRQPLADLQLTIDAIAASSLKENYAQIIADEINVKKVSFGILAEANHSFKISGESEDWVMHTKESGVTFALMIKVTDELRAEGIAADIIRHIADARKKAGMSMNDKASAMVSVDDSNIISSIEKHKEKIMQDTGLVALEFGVVEGDAVKVEGEEVRVKIDKK